MDTERTFTREVKTPNITINFKFKGIPKKENIDYDLIEDLLNNYFNPSVLTDDVVKNIICIRTILDDFDEKYFSIHINSTKPTNVFVQYDDKKINMYNTTEPIKDSYADFFVVEYIKKFGLKYSFSNANEKIIEYPLNQKILDLINENMKKIVYLDNLKSITLDIEGKVICNLYKLFYDEDVDFSSKDINVKIQAMMFLLQEFGVTFDKEITFIMFKNKMPISVYLYEKVNSLFPLGKIENLGNDVKIYEEASKITKSIGLIVREYMHNSDDEIETLRQISRVFYAKSNCLRINAKLEEIADYCNYPTNEVEKTLKLIKKIDKKLED